MIYFVSDFHFGHNKPFIYEKRGFTAIEEHDEKLIQNFNSVVKENDITYFLGDFSFNKQKLPRYFNALHGKFIVIHGNHDKDFFQLFNTKKLLNIIEYKFGYFDTQINDKYFTLNHYPMRSWNKSHYGTYHLYGHIHSKTDFLDRSLNVSIDNLNNFPISFDEVVDYMEKRPYNFD